MSYVTQIRGTVYNLDEIVHLVKALGLHPINHKFGSH